MCVQFFDVVGFTTENACSHTSSLAMTERPHELSNCKGVGHFEAKFLVEGLCFALTSMDRYMENYYTTPLPLDVSTQRSFVADFIRLKLDFV